LIIDYKNELLHEHTALQAILFAYGQYKMNIQKDEADEGEGYYAPLNAILSCIAGSHKLDHIRLCCDETSNHFLLFESYRADFLKGDARSAAVAKYQTARREDQIDGMKPYQIINAYLARKSLTLSQNFKANLWLKRINEAFEVASKRYCLQVGQRLFRGVTLTEKELAVYQQALAKGEKIRSEGFASTSLSESIALAFAVFSDTRHLENHSELEVEENEPHVPVVFELTNRYKNLPFLMPDALRRPERSQGQMEVLLPHGIWFQPTYIDFKDKLIKIYADLVS